MDAPIGILGGTFDPIHEGHLRPALEVLEDLRLAEVRFVPCGRPPHRGAPVAPARDRLAMLRLAIAGQPGFVIDDREIRREGPSYMVDTLRGLRDELADRPLCLLLGVDAFDGLHEWHRWQELPRLAHLVVFHRPGAGLPLSEAQGELLLQHKLHDSDELRNRSAGGILFHPVTQLDVSGTRIRELIGEGRSPRYLLPQAVWAYMQEHALYGAPSAAGVA